MTGRNGAEGGTRTPTGLRPHDPESCASTSSATSAERDPHHGRRARGKVNGKVLAQSMTGGSGSAPSPSEHFMCCRCCGNSTLDPSLPASDCRGRGRAVARHQDGHPLPTCASATGSCRPAAQPPSEPSRSLSGRDQAVAQCSCGRLGAPPGATRWPEPGNPEHPRRALYASTCRPRATWAGAAGPLGGRRPGKPRRAPCTLSAWSVNTEGPGP